MTHSLFNFQFGDGFKLLSVGSAVPIGEATNPRRGWYFPPEAVTSTKKNKLKLRSKTSVSSIAATTAIDTWAFGILLFELVLGASLPLYKRSVDRNSNAINVKKWNEKVLDKALMGLRYENEAAADLLSGLLHPNPARRISSIDAVLRHELFAGRTEEDQATTPSKPPPDTTPEVDIDKWEDSSTMKNPKDVVYSTHEKYKSRGADDEPTDPHNEPELSTSCKAYPIQERRVPSNPKEFLALERRIYPIQERTVYPIQESSTMSSDEGLSKRNLDEKDTARADEAPPGKDIELMTTCSSEDSDNISEPGRIIIGSRKKKATVVVTERKSIIYDEEQSI